MTAKPELHPDQRANEISFPLSTSYVPVCLRVYVSPFINSLHELYEAAIFFSDKETEAQRS